MILTLNFGFYEPFSGVWMTGERDLWINSKKDADKVEQRYRDYFKSTYGERAKVFRIGLKKD